MRIINGGSGTNFFVDLGSLTGELIATDGIVEWAIQASAIFQGAFTPAARQRSGKAHKSLPHNGLNIQSVGVSERT
jgi:hypothetical protein